LVWHREKTEVLSNFNKWKGQNILQTEWSIFDLNSNRKCFDPNLRGKIRCREGGFDREPEKVASKAQTKRSGCRGEKRGSTGRTARDRMSCSSRSAEKKPMGGNARRGWSTRLSLVQGGTSRGARTRALTARFAESTEKKKQKKARDYTSTK